jgi:hypothetical protein
MAINLWKLAGKPTSYNPLPIGLTNFAWFEIGDYVIRFRAKAPTPNAKIRAISNGVSQMDFVLTNTFKTFELVLNRPSYGVFYIYDPNSLGNIEVDSIEVVRKPLSKLTINGLDGFLSGKWSIHPNARVIDDETLELNATGVHQYSTLKLEVNKNTNYILSIQEPQRIAVYNEALSNPIVPLTVTNNMSFNSGTNSVIQIVFSNNLAGRYIFKKPMLNMGSIPAPYEPKRGDKMVLPVSAMKRNLIINNLAAFASGLSFNGEYFNKTANTGYDGYQEVKVKPNQSYVFSAVGYKANSTTGQLSLQFRDSLGNVVGGNKSLFMNNSVQTEFQTGVIVSPPNAVTARIYSIAGVGNTIYFKDVQLEEGTTATPYEPYAVQVNKKPFKPIALPKRVKTAKRVLEAKR